MMCKPAPAMEKNIAQETKPKQRRRDRPIMSLLDNITAWFGFSLESVLCMAGNCNE